MPRTTMLIGFAGVMLLAPVTAADIITYRAEGTTSLPGAGIVILEYSYDLDADPIVPGGLTWSLNPSDVTLTLDGVDQGDPTAATHGVTLTQPGPIGDDRYNADLFFAGGVATCFCWVDDIDPTMGFVTGPELPGLAFDPSMALLAEWFIVLPIGSEDVRLTSFTAMSEPSGPVIPLPTGAAMGAAGLLVLFLQRRRR